MTPEMTARTLLGVSALFLWMSWAPCLARGTPEDQAPRQPHFDATKHRTEYAGPGREDPAPEGLKEVSIGYFGPADPAHPEGGDIWLAASLAIEQANRSGGYRGLPFRLVPAWSENPWGTGVARVARLAFSDSVWAVVGSIDGASTHLAEQVVAKARLTLISPAGTDRSVNLANVAWMFSCLPADDQHATVIGQALEDRIGRQPFTLISATDHDSHVAAVELKNYLARRGIPPLHHLEFEPGTRDLSAFVRRIGRTVAVYAGPIDSARFMVSLRASRPDTLVLGGPSMGRRIFVQRAGPAAEGVLFPLLCDPSVLSGSFARNFASRFDRHLDCTAAQAYDAVKLLIAAIEKAGLNRARIRDAVQELSPWPGVSGTIEWNLLGQNRRKVRLATIEGGRIVPVHSDASGELAVRERSED